MKLKALLLCEDIRLEVGGTVTLVGVFNERLIAPPGQGAIEVAKLSCLAVLGGLRGVEEIKYRHWIRIGNAEVPPGELVTERHAPANDEHNFVFTESPMVFPQVGAYEVGLDVEVAGERQGYRYQFTVERA
jgi:hypothetical protein